MHSYFYAANITVNAIRPRASVPASHSHASTNPLLEGNETRRVSGTDTGPTVLDGLAVVVVSSYSLCAPLSPEIR